MSLSLPAAFAVAVCACSAFGQSFVDSSRAELLQKAPELAGLEFSPNQSTLDPLLRETGQQLESMLARFMNVSIGENVHEMRFDSATLMWKERRDEFRYLVRTRPFVESRSPVGNQAPSDGSGRFLISGDLIGLLGDLLPENQQLARFRYLGQIQENGRKAQVIAFTEKDGEREGLAWLDEPSKRILRIRCDFLKAPAGQAFNSFSQDIRFVPVSFSPPNRRCGCPLVRPRTSGSPAVNSIPSIDSPITAWKSSRAASVDRPNRSPCKMTKSKYCCRG